MKLSTMNTCYLNVGERDERRKLVKNTNIHMILQEREYVYPHLSCWLKCLSLFSITHFIIPSPSPSFHSTAYFPFFHPQGQQHRQSLSESDPPLPISHLFLTILVFSHCSNKEACDYIRTAKIIQESLPLKKAHRYLNTSESSF